MMVRWLMTAAVAAILAGCAATGSVSRPAPAAASVSAGGAEPVLSALPGAGIGSGECGMILWTLEAERPAPIFRYIAGKGAQIRVGGAGAATDLVAVSSSGASGYGVSEEQVFVAADGAALTVRVRFGLGFDGGAYLERGLLTLETSDGWRSVTPAAGIAGCRS